MWRRKLASALQAASPELLKTKQARRWCTLCPLARQFACTLALQVAPESREAASKEAASINKKLEMLSLTVTLILLLAVEAQKNRAPVCAIGLKKGARVRLPGGARGASQALQIRVRKQLPIPIIMIIDGDDLRRDAPSVVGAVERFVGLPPQPPLSAEDVTEASVRKKIAKTFPSFDERIGWSIHGAYDDEGLPGEVEERLSAFFKPHDEAFFEILGRRLAWRT